MKKASCLLPLPGRGLVIATCEAKVNASRVNRASRSGSLGE